MKDRSFSKNSRPSLPLNGFVFGTPLTEGMLTKNHEVKTLNIEISIG